MPAYAAASATAQAVLVASAAVQSVSPAISIAGDSSGTKSKARWQIPLPRPKRLATTTKSRLAVEGPPAPTTPEASSYGGGTQLIKSLGFDFKHATPFLCYIAACH